MEKVTSKLCMAKDVGLNGNLFGGNMMAWMDEAAAIFAHEYTKEKNMVTYRFGEMKFLKAVKQGDIINFLCGDVKKGKSSVTFSIEGRVKSNAVFSTDCTFVAIDENGNKKEIL